MSWDLSTLQQETFARYIPVCKECGSNVTTIHADFTKSEKFHLACGHSPHFVMIPNPKLVQE